MSSIHRFRAACLALLAAAAAACVSTAGLDGASSTPDASAPEGPGSPDASADAARDDVVQADATDATRDAAAGIAELHEEFAVPLDPTRWLVDIPPPFSSTQASEQLHLTCTTSTTKDAYIRTIAAYDAREGSVHVDLVNAGAAGVGSDGGGTTVVWMKMAQAASSNGVNAVEIGVLNGNLYAKHFIAGVPTGVKSTKYFPATMAWLRLRASVSAGGVFYEYAGDSTGPWQELAAEPIPIALDAVTVEMGAGNGTPGEVVFDHVNGP